MDRRRFLSVAGLAAGGALAIPQALAEDGSDERPEFSGVLVDTTRCIGCRQCEVSCAEAHGLPIPEPATDHALDRPRDTSPGQWTVVNRQSTEQGDVFVKRQCMHCDQPACAAACPTNAMEKTKEGPVIWHGDRCMGCRYCMVACPYQIPKFEYHSPNPRISKCILCFERLEQGEQPACVQGCPADALMFGPKRELLQLARARISSHPGRYVHRIYGEHEAGGTGWLYLSAVPFEQLGLREDVGVLPLPDYTREFLYGVPAVFMLVPPLLFGLHQLTASCAGIEEED